MFKKLLSSCLSILLLVTQVILSPSLVQSLYAQSAISLPATPPADHIWKSRSLRPSSSTEQYKATQKTGPFSYLNPLLKSINPHATVREIKKGHPHQPFIFVIQDVHANADAQHNIAQTLQQIHKRFSAEEYIVGVEAASGPFDFEPFRQIPNQQVVRTVADYLLKEDIIAAASHFGLTAPGQLPLIVGVDSPEMYRQNVEAYQEAHRTKRNESREIQKQIKNLEKLAQDGFSKKLKDFYEDDSAFQSGRKTIENYIDELSQFVSIRKYKNITHLKKAIELEKNIDLKKVTSQREKMMIRLAGSDKKSVQSLAHLTLNYRSGQLNTQQFFNQLLTKAKKSGVEMNSFGDLVNYATYLDMAERIDHAEMFNEIKAMRQKAVERIARSPEDKDIFNSLNNLHLKQKLINFELTPNEWEQYVGATRRVAQESSAPGRGTASPLHSFESFYRAAHQRDNAMATNFLSAVKENNSQVAVLVVGGFHTDGVKKVIKENNASYALLTPRFSLSGVQSGSEYLDAFIREKTPLSKIFFGDKLTVASASHQLGANQRMSSQAAGRTSFAILASVLGSIQNITTNSLRKMFSAVTWGRGALKSAEDGIVQFVLSGENLVAKWGGKITNSNHIQTYPQVDGNNVVVYVDTNRKALGMALLGILGSLISTGYQLLFIGKIDPVLSLAGGIIAMAIQRENLSDRESVYSDIGLITPEELWSKIRTGNIQDIQTGITNPDVQNIFDQKVWQYYLEHSIQDLVNDMSIMDDEDIALILKNPEVMKTDHRLPKAKRIIEALKPKKSAAVLDLLPRDLIKRIEEARIRKVTAVSSENDFYKTGGIGDVEGARPKVLWGFGHDTDQFMPFFEGVGIEEYLVNNNLEAIELDALEVPMNEKMVKAKIYLVERNDGPPVILIQSDEYFGESKLGRPRKADGSIDMKGKPNPYYANHPDFTMSEKMALERFIFFSKAVMFSMLEMSKKGFYEAPETIHLNDWQTMLIAPWLLYLKKTTPAKFEMDRMKPENSHMRGVSVPQFKELKKFFEKTVPIATVHNAAYQGLFSDDSLFFHFDKQVKQYSWQLFEALGLPVDPFFIKGGEFSLEYYNQTDFGLGIQSLSAAYTVSTKHVDELQVPEEEEGPGFIPAVYQRLAKQGRFFGIQNGVGYDKSPSSTPGIRRFGITNYKKIKPINKERLLRQVGLLKPEEDFDPSIPVVGVVSRLEKEKGHDFILEAISEKLKNGQKAYYIILGTGKTKYEDAYLKLQSQFPNSVAAEIRWDPLLSNKIIAGSDIFLAPSTFEPSGLTHFYAMLAGTIPIVTPVGGLDLVVDHSEDRKKATGYKMNGFSGQALLEKLNRAIWDFKEREDEPNWTQMMENGMRSNFFWPDVVDKIIDAYDLADRNMEKLILQESANPPTNNRLVLKWIKENIAARFHEEFRGPKGEEAYAKKWYGAMLYEAIFIVLPLATFYSILIPSMGGALLATAASFLAVHYYTDFIIALATLTLLLVNPSINGPNANRGSPSIISGNEFTPSPHKGNSPQAVAVATIKSQILSQAVAPRPYESWNLKRESFLFDNLIPRMIGSVVMFLPAYIILVNFVLPADFIRPELAQAIAIAIASMPGHWGWNNLGWKKPLSPDYNPVPELVFGSGRWPGLSGEFEEQLSQGNPVRFGSDEGTKNGTSKDLVLKNTVARMVRGGDWPAPNGLPRRKVVLVIPRRVYQGGNSSEFYNTPIAQDLRRRYGDNIEIFWNDFPAQGLPSDWNGMVENADRVFLSPEPPAAGQSNLRDLVDQGYPVLITTDAGLKTRLRLGALATWMGLVPLPSGNFASEQVSNHFSLMAQLPNLGKDTLMVRGSDNVNMDEELLMGQVPLNESGENEDTKGWKVLFFGQPLTILDSKNMQVLDASLTDDEKDGSKTVTDARLQSILGQAELDRIYDRVKKVKDLGVIHRDPKNGELVRLLEKYPTMGLNEYDVVQKAYQAGGQLLKNMYQWAIKKDAAMARSDIANFPITWRHQGLRLRDVYKPRYFQVMGTMISFESAEDFIALLPSDLKETIDRQPSQESHLKLMWHLAQAFHKGGKIEFFEKKDPSGDVIDWGIRRTSQNGNTIFIARPGVSYVFSGASGNFVPTLITGDAPSPIESDNSIYNLVVDEFKDDSWEVTSRVLKPHPIHVVSIGDNAYWKDAGKYTELRDLYQWVFFQEEGRKYAGFPPPNQRIVDSYIDPDVNLDTRGEHAIINSSIRGKGKVIIEKGAALAWVDIHVPEGEVLTIGPDYIWVVGSVDGGGELFSGPLDHERGGLFINYFHPNPGEPGYEPFNSDGGEVRKTVIGWNGETKRNEKVILKDSLFEWDSDNGTHIPNNSKFGDEKIGRPGIEYTFEEWRTKIDTQKMSSEISELTNDIVDRAKTTESSVQLEASAMRIGDDAILLRSQDNGNGEIEWALNPLSSDPTGIRPDRYNGSSVEYVRDGESHTEYLGSFSVVFTPVGRIVSPFDSESALKIEVYDQAQEKLLQEFYLTDSDRNEEDQTIVFHDGNPTAIGRYGTWESFGPDLLDEEGRNISFRSRWIEDNKNITKPSSRHVSVAEKIEFVKSGRAYASREELTAIEKEEESILVQAQDTQIFGKSEDNNLLRKLSALVDPLSRRQDLPRAIAWPPLVRQGTLNLDLIGQIDLIEKGLNELLGSDRNIKLGDIIDHIIVPDWNDDDVRKNVRDPFYDAQLKKDEKDRNRRFHVGQDQIEKLAERGIRVMKTSELEAVPVKNENGEEIDVVVHYKNEDLNAVMRMLSINRNIVLGYGSEASDQTALVMFDLERSLVEHHHSNQDRGRLTDSKSKKVGSLLKNLFKNGLRFGITSTAPLRRIRDALVMRPKDVTIRELILNSDAAHRILMLNRQNGEITESIDEKYEKNRLISQEDASAIVLLIKDLIKEKHREWTSSRRLFNALSKYYLNFSFRKRPGVELEQAEGTDFVSRIFIRNVPSEEVHVQTGNGWPTYETEEGVTTPLPRVREEMIEELQEKIDSVYIGEKRFKVIPIGEVYLAIVQVPVNNQGEFEDYGKQSFFNHIREVYGLTKERTLYVADQIYSENSPDYIQGVTMAATNRNQRSVPQDVFPVGPDQQGAEKVLTRLLEIIREQKILAFPRPAVEVYIEELNAARAASDAETPVMEIDNSPDPTMIEAELDVISRTNKSYEIRFEGGLDKFIEVLKKLAEALRTRQNIPRVIVWPIERDGSYFRQDIQALQEALGDVALSQVITHIIFPYWYSESEVGFLLELGILGVRTSHIHNENGRNQYDKESINSLLKKFRENYALLQGRSEDPNVKSALAVSLNSLISWRRPDGKRNVEDPKADLGLSMFQGLLDIGLNLVGLTERSLAEVMDSHEDRMPVPQVDSPYVGFADAAHREYTFERGEDGTLKEPVANELYEEGRLFTQDEADQIKEMAERAIIKNYWKRFVGDAEFNADMRFAYPGFYRDLSNDQLKPEVQIEAEGGVIYRVLVSNIPSPRLLNKDALGEIEDGSNQEKAMKIRGRIINAIRNTIIGRFNGGGLKVSVKPIGDNMVEIVRQSEGTVGKEGAVNYYLDSQKMKGGNFLFVAGNIFLREENRDGFNQEGGESEQREVTSRYRRSPNYITRGYKAATNGQQFDPTIPGDVFKVGSASEGLGFVYVAQMAIDIFNEERLNPNPEKSVVQILIERLKSINEARNRALQPKSNATNAWDAIHVDRVENPSQDLVGNFYLAVTEALIDRVDLNEVISWVEAYESPIDLNEVIREVINANIDLTEFNDNVPDLIGATREALDEYVRRDWTFGLVLNQFVRDYNKGRDGPEQIKPFDVVINGFNLTTLMPTENPATSTPIHMFYTGNFMFFAGFIAKIFIIGFDSVSPVWLNGLLLGAMLAIVSGFIPLFWGPHDYPVAITNPSDADTLTEKLFGELTNKFSDLPFPLQLAHRMEEFSHYILYAFVSHNPKVWQNEFLSHALSIGQFFLLGLSWTVAPASVQGTSLVVLVLITLIDFYANRVSKKSFLYVRPPPRVDSQSHLKVGLKVLEKSPQPIYNLQKLRNISPSILLDDQISEIAAPGQTFSERAVREPVINAVDPLTRDVIEKLRRAIEKAKDYDEVKSLAVTYGTAIGIRLAISGRSDFYNHAVVVAALLAGGRNVNGSFFIPKIESAMRKAAKEYEEYILAEDSPVQLESLGDELATEDFVYFHFQDLRGASDKAWIDKDSDFSQYFVKRLEMISQILESDSNTALLLSVSESEQDGALSELANLYSDHGLDVPSFNGKVFFHVSEKANPYAAILSIDSNSSSIESLAAYPFSMENWEFSIEEFMQLQELNPEIIPNIVIEMLNFKTDRIIRIQTSIHAALMALIAA